MMKKTYMAVLMTGLMLIIILSIGVIANAAIVKKSNTDSVDANDTGSIRIYLRDADNSQFISGATVKANLITIPEISLRTYYKNLITIPEISLGTYHKDGLTTGTYQIQISKVGYASIGLYMIVLKNTCVFTTVYLVPDAPPSTL